MRSSAVILLELLFFFQSGQELMGSTRDKGENLDRDFHNRC